MMTLTVNGINREYPEGQTVQQLLAQLQLSAENVVVELNREILVSDRQAETELKAGDIIELVQFVGGG